MLMWRKQKRTNLQAVLQYSIYYFVNRFIQLNQAIMLSVPKSKVTCVTLLVSDDWRS